jgi:DNA primase
MARIPEAELERIKEEVSLERLAEARGVKLRRQGRDLRGRCPFHEPDEDPSLSIDPERNVFHCFGCGAKGSVIDWVMKTEGVSFRHAVELLRHEAPLVSEAKGKGGGVPKVSTVRRLEAPVSVEADAHELLEQVVGYYHETFRQEQAAREYLESRGLGDPSFAESHRVGFANRTLGLRLPEKNRVAGGELRGRLQELGVFRESGHEHLNGCVVLGTDDEEGRIVGLPPPPIEVPGECRRDGENSPARRRVGGFLRSFVCRDGSKRELRGEDSGLREPLCRFWRVAAVSSWTSARTAAQR